MEIEEALKIHEALHSKAHTVTAAHNTFNIVLSKSNGCRTVNVFGTFWMVQNTKKPSAYTLRAMSGEKLTWIMTKPKWGLIANGEVEIWCSALKKPVVNANDDPTQKSTKRRKLNSSQPKTTASDDITSDPIDRSIEDGGTRRITRSASRAQNTPKIKSEADPEDTVKAEDMEMSNEPSSDLFSDGDTERIVYAQKKIQGSGLSSDFSVVSIGKTGSGINSNNPTTNSSHSNKDSNDMEVEEDESTIAYNNNKPAQKEVKEDVQDDSTIVYNNNKPQQQGPNNNTPVPVKVEPPKPAMAKKKGSAYNQSKGSGDIIPVWQIAFEELTLGDKLGAGAFGEVRKGRYRGTDVAIKILHTQDEENTAMFFKEAELMCKLRHPNVIQCLGASVAPPNLSIVMELMNSNLSRFIRSGPIEDKIMVKVAIGIARGINFLHTAKPKIIHRDLKPDNILLDDNHLPKIADFGVSRENFATETMTRIGTPAYCAPEILNNMKYNEKVDIFSFGMMLHSMVTGGPPFFKSGPKGTPLAALQIMMKLAVQKERPTMPDKILPEIKELIEACWQHDAKDRPTSEEVLFKLENFVYAKYWPNK